MSLVIRKIDLPDEVVVEHEGAKFIFGHPLSLDLFDFRLSNNGEIVRYAVAKIKRIEGFSFEDGTPVSVADFKHLPFPFLVEIGNLFAEKILPYFQREVELKKEPETNELLVS